jgi:hypothetical protein
VADTSDLSDELKTAVSNPIGVASISKLNAPKPVAKPAPVAPVKPVVVAKAAPQPEATQVPAKPVAPAKPKVAKPPLKVDKQTLFNELTLQLSQEPLPDVLNPLLKLKLESGKANFLYLPWIVTHGDKLIQQLGSNDHYAIRPLNIADNMANLEVRRAIGAFARNHAGTYKNYLKQQLLPLRKKIKGMLFTMDWPPAMRLLAEVCQELGIPRILVPHESVFVDPSKYYVCVASMASTPLCDVILAWGDLQANIFIERGYPADRIIKVGAPKFDIYHDYKPLYEYEDFCTLYGFDVAKRTVLFAAQPMDSQFDDVKLARNQQSKAIGDAFALAQAKGWNFLLRMPPSGDNVITQQLRQAIYTAPNAFIDQGVYLLGPEECIYHSSYVASVNSTMLFEALLMGRRCLSLKYLEFDQFWQECGIPSVTNAEELAALITQWEDGAFSIDETKLAWAAQQLSNGAFDGKAAKRIKQYLRQVAEDTIKVELLPNAKQRVLQQHPMKLNVVALPNALNNFDVVDGPQKHLLPMLNATTRVCGDIATIKHTPTLASVDLFVQWGITPNEPKARQDFFTRYLSKPKLIIEDGFIRSVEIGLTGSPALSIIMDEVSAYYDATVETGLQKRLNSDDWQLTDEQLAEANRLMARIVKHRVTKYNDAKDFSLKAGRPGVPKVLLIDQRFGDQSVSSGLADEQTFSRMLDYALSNYKHHDILVKQHPDALKGGKLAYYSTEVIAPYVTHANVVPIDFDINPYALFDAVEDVLVVTSGMGFEAALAGKNVLTFGAPFYAGHGFTTDKLGDIPHRKRPRTLAEVFYAAYVEHSRYYSPTLERRCSLDEVIEHIVQARGW